MNKYMKYMGALAGVLSLAFASCNTDIVNPLREDYPQNQVETTKGKVLWIVMDGASGLAVREASNDLKAPTIRGMRDHAIYTFNGLASTKADQPVDGLQGWDNLLTGTLDGTSAEPSALKRLKELDKSKTIAVYASTDGFYNLCQADADSKFKSASDKEVADKLETSLKNDTSDFVIAEFNGVEQAGKKAGFDYTDGDGKRQPTEEVMNAVSEVDKYVGRIMNALKARPNYATENWLIILTSNYGGVTYVEGDNVYKMADRNTFSMMYNEKFSNKLEVEPGDDQLKYSYFTPLYGGNNLTKNAVVKDYSLFDFRFKDEKGDTLNYTVQFMYKALKSGKQSGYELVSCAEQTQPKSGQGWDVFQDGEQFRSFTSSGGSNRADSKFSPKLSDGKWHTVTMIYDLRQRRVYQYQDGKSNAYNGREFLPLKENPDSIATDPAKKCALTIGQIKKSVTKNGNGFLITNLQIYNVALPLDFVAKNYKQTGLDELAEEWPYWDNLIGYWPCDREDDFKQKELKDYSKYGSVFNGVNAGKSDLVLSEDAKWYNGSEQDPNVKPIINASYYQSVINLVDIPYQTFQWFGLTVPSSWKWTGIARQLPYTDLQTNN